METEHKLQQECIKKSWVFPDRSDTPEIRSEKREKLEQLLQVGCDLADLAKRL